MRFRFSQGAIVLAILALFAVLNGRAYWGYFSDDDLDNLAWTSYVGIDEFERGIVDLKFNPDNFRPVGHFYFWAMGRLAGDHFAPYIAVLHVLFLGTAVLLFFLLRRMGYEELPSLAAVFLWVFHYALFDAIWKPMYIFDVLCGLFCLLTFHAWLSGRWIIAFLTFWLAYKSKEVALFFPMVLLFYEFTAGKRRWKQLLPLFAVSANFGIQVILREKGPDNAYTLHFTFDALRKCVDFYFTESGGILFLLFILIGLVPRRSYWSAAGAILIMIPLLFLPGRLFAVYLFVPLLIFSPTLAGAFYRPRIALPLVLIWAGYDYFAMRPKWRAYRAQSTQIRSYVDQLREYVQQHPQSRTLLCDSMPYVFNIWGVAGAVHWFSRDPNIVVRYDANAASSADARKNGTVVLHWDRENARLIVVDPL